MAKKFFRNSNNKNPFKKKNKKKKTDDKNDDNIEIVGNNFKSEELKDNTEKDDNESDDNFNDIRLEKTKKSKKSGGFQSMGFSHNVLKGVLRKGYRVPTPIQRKTIPEIMSGKDVVAMARTGSGKTAAFLLPLLDKLRSHSAKVGVRGLIISPTRELALQTYKFTKELSKFTDLKAICVLGGDSMERQFAAIHENPDIMIATPGRLLHVMVEMNLKLLTVEYVVFDEADRLFEMGFKEQLNEILSRLPDQRQTLLFSATLPQQIVDFTKAGLNDPVLIRLDTESKLSENLRNVFISCRNEEKVSVLLYLIKNIISVTQLTVVFVETRHHVEYLKDILENSDIECSYLYSSLDMEARKMNVQNFQQRRKKVLLVTDVAARGVDIPLLDNVINYNFPPKPKLFVHRVGRVARAGRKGTAYSLVAPDELPYLYSLNLFLNREFKLAKPESTSTEDGLLGSVPQHIIDEETETIERLHSIHSDLSSMKKVCSNAYKQYIKSRPTADSESVRNVKKIMTKDLENHPIFKQSLEKSDMTDAKNNLLNSIRNYRPNSTIFETGKTKGSLGFEVMQKKRKIFDKIVEKFGSNKKIDSEFDQMNDKFKDNKFYVPYQSNQHFSEKGLELEKPFNAEIASAVLDLNGDESETLSRANNQLKWDRKKKKFIANGNTEKAKKRIKTESGNWISASYKSDLYKKWKIKSKAEQQESDEEMNEEKVERDKELSLKKNKIKNVSKRPPKRELKTKEEIYKERQKMERKKSYQKWKQNERQKKKDKH